MPGDPFGTGGPPQHYYTHPPMPPMQVQHHQHQHQQYQPPLPPLHLGHHIVRPGGPSGAFHTSGGGSSDPAGVQGAGVGDLTSDSALGLGYPHQQSQSQPQPQPLTHLQPPYSAPPPDMHTHTQTVRPLSLSPNDYNMPLATAPPVMYPHSSSPPFRHVFERLAPPPSGGAAAPQVRMQEEIPQPQPQAHPQSQSQAQPQQSQSQARLSPNLGGSALKAAQAKAAPAATVSPGEIDNNEVPSDASAAAADINNLLAGLQDSKKRASKACETCRVRRTKCVGGRPCDPCRALGVAEDCIVRVKARPNRALPKTLTENGITAGPQFDASDLDRMAHADTLGEPRSTSTPVRRPTRTESGGTKRSAGTASGPAGPLDTPPSASKRVASASATRSEVPVSEVLNDAMRRIEPPKEPVSEAPHAGVLHTGFVEDIEASLESWARDRGQHLNLSLSAPSPLAQLLENPPALPPLNNPIEEQAMHVFIRALGTYFDFLPPQRITDLVARYHASPNSLSVDQRCLVWACICLGIFRERRWPAADTPGSHFRSARATSSTHVTPTAAGDGPGTGFDYGPRGTGNGGSEEAPYYAAAVRSLDEWGSASSTALIALHVLHLYALTAGGPQDMRGILGRMAWQVRELGFHRDVTAKLYPPSDSADRLFFMTLYKDSWFATLTGLPPYLAAGSFDTHFSRPNTTAPNLPADAAQEYQRGIDAHPFLVQLTFFENELATLMNAPDAQVSIDMVLELERKWGDWMVVFRDDQLKGWKPMHHSFSMIRFHWIRLMLRTPFLSSSSLRLSSLSIIARSCAQILNTYATFAHTQVFIASYGELKRIMTCGYLLCVCYWERELDRGETEILMGLCEALVRKLEQAERLGDGGVVKGKAQILRQLAALLDLNPQTPASPNLVLQPEPDPALLPPLGNALNAGADGNAPSSMQEFEAQQTVDALFAYPYSLDWSMPENVENWLGMGSMEYIPPPPPSLPPQHQHLPQVEHVMTAAHHQPPGMGVGYGVEGMPVHLMQGMYPQQQ